MISKGAGGFYNFGQFLNFESYARNSWVADKKQKKNVELY